MSAMMCPWCHSQTENPDNHPCIPKARAFKTLADSPRLQKEADRMNLIAFMNMFHPKTVNTTKKMQEFLE